MIPMAKGATEEIEEPWVIHTWANNRISNTVLMSIPHKLAKKYGIKPNTNLLAIDTNDGILLKRIKTELI